MNNQNQLITRSSEKNQNIQLDFGKVNFLRGDIKKKEGNPKSHRLLSYWLCNKNERLKDISTEKIKNEEESKFRSKTPRKAKDDKTY